MGLGPDKLSADDIHLLGGDVAGEHLVEAARGLGPVEWADRRADHVIDDVRGIHRHRSLGIARLLCLQVLLDEPVDVLAVKQKRSANSGKRRYELKRRAE